MAPQVPRGLKPLAVMLGEYVALREADERRAHLFAKNPALRDMFQIIETQSAALQPTYAGQVRVRPANLTHAIIGRSQCWRQGVVLHVMGLGVHRSALSGRLLVLTVAIMAESQGQKSNSMFAATSRDLGCKNYYDLHIC